MLFAVVVDSDHGESVELATLTSGLLGSPRFKRLVVLMMLLLVVLKDLLERVTTTHKREVTPFDSLREATFAFLSASLSIFVRLSCFST